MRLSRKIASEFLNSKTMGMNLHKVVLIIGVLLAVASCNPEPQPSYKPTPYEFPQPAYFPSKNNIPEDNPMTEEGVALGRKLFYDSRLSGRDGTDGIRNCAACHRREKNFDFGGSAGLHHAAIPAQA